MISAISGWGVAGVCSIALSAEPSRSATLQAMETIRKTGGFVSFDPNIRHDLWRHDAELRQCLAQALTKADVVKLSVEELSYLTGEHQVQDGLTALMQSCPASLVLVTRGKEGVITWHEGTMTHYPATSVECVDTTGAGDAFVAGLLYGLASAGSAIPHHLPDNRTRTTLRRTRHNGQRGNDCTAVSPRTVISLRRLPIGGLNCCPDHNC